MFGLKKEQKKGSGGGTRAERQDPRTSKVNAEVRIDSKTYTVSDFSASGFRITGYDGPLIEKQRFRFSFFADDGKEKLDFDGNGSVVRLKGGDLSAKFKFVNPSQEKKVRQFIERNGGSL